ncbi:hypothetical protein [Streptomyces sp. AK02-01A]|uniref:hypothetical protein n=1 Tax=Streptomyces sp. AK02-01A TaxID=3028648 RepID=UPI0029AE657A|nr:hypothetical protein [Streptomyces sp. AK02-01A]MDX3854371.1 hypothetical protein [Streptomyces sp. AK02-01A]
MAPPEKRYAAASSPRSGASAGSTLRYLARASARFSVNPPMHSRPALSSASMTPVASWASYERSCTATVTPSVSPGTSALRWTSATGSNAVAPPVRLTSGWQTAGSAV